MARGRVARRITSACAEQTGTLKGVGPKFGDHLRVCGADTWRRCRPTPRRGSPPRVRSRLAFDGPRRLLAGITSACAEQTENASVEIGDRTDHLRVCGADVLHNHLQVGQLGSPPRVRSRRLCRRGQGVAAGITSACAEQTRRSHDRMNSCWDHLRVCGADLVESCELDAVPGSPPRVRSRPFQPCLYVYHDRITSACAEQTGIRTYGRLLAGDHLRVCGADAAAVAVVMLVAGSPPRVRSRRTSGGLVGGLGGITSACAEQTP